MFTEFYILVSDQCHESLSFFFRFFFCKTYWQHQNVLIHGEKVWSWIFSFYHHVASSTSTIHANSLNSRVGLWSAVFLHAIDTGVGIAYFALSTVVFCQVHLVKNIDVLMCVRWSTLGTSSHFMVWCFCIVITCDFIKKKENKMETAFLCLLQKHLYHNCKKNGLPILNQWGDVQA